MRRLLWVLWLGTAVPLASLAQSDEEEEAGDVSEIDKDATGPLRERIRPVSGHMFLKQGRFELSPSATVSLRDSFFTKYVFGGALTYHPVETLGISLRGGYSLPTVAPTAQICITDPDRTRECRLPSFEELDGRAPGQITLLAGLDVQWAPIYGKLAVLAEQFLHFDLYGIAGGALIGYEGPDVATSGPASYLTPGLNLGVGARVFLNRWMTVRAEFRDTFYFERIRPDGTSLRNQILFELGFSVFFPTSFGEL